MNNLSIISFHKKYTYSYWLAVNKILDENDSIVGWCDVELFNDEKVILGIGVLGPYRNIGYGKLLIRNMISICKEKRYKYLCLQVRENNKRALHVYSSLGFKEYNRIIDVYCNNDFKEHIIEMVLDL